MQALQINPADDVATMIDGVAAGDAVAIGARTVIARDAIPRGHKIALGAIADGADIIKYGVPIGHATQTIAAASWALRPSTSRSRIASRCSSGSAAIAADSA